MAVVMIQDQWGISPDFITKLTEEIDAKAKPPAGMVVHTAVQVEGGVRIIDVWESREAIDRFFQDRLMPAAQALAHRENMELPQPPEPQIVEAFDIVHGSTTQ
jgi:quinol monooxygenase YgiN